MIELACMLRRPSPLSALQLVSMRSAMPDADVLKMVDELPRILADDSDVGERILGTMRKLFVLCPTKDMCSADVSGILESHPELIYRLESCSDDVDFNSLPIDIQNILVIAGGGGGESYASWRYEDQDLDQSFRYGDDDDGGGDGSLSSNECL